MNKRKGVSPGFPDFLVVGRNGLVFVELKRSQYGKISDEQRAWLAALGVAGCPGSVCYGAKEAIKFLEQYV